MCMFSGSLFTSWSICWMWVKSSHQKCSLRHKVHCFSSFWVRKKSKQGSQILVKWNFFVIKLTQLQFVKQQFLLNADGRAVCLEGTEKWCKCDSLTTGWVMGVTTSQVIFNEWVNPKDETTPSINNDRLPADREWTQNVSTGIDSYFFASVWR